MIEVFDPSTMNVGVLCLDEEGSFASPFETRISDMRFFGTVIKAGCILCGVLTANTAIAMSNTINGHSYSVCVFSSFGTSFRDCFKFDYNGSLIVEGNRTGAPLIYCHDQLNPAPEAWQAGAGTTRGGFILTFHGTVAGTEGQTIIANGLSNAGDTLSCRASKSSLATCGRLKRPTPLVPTWKSANSKNLT